MADECTVNQAKLYVNVNFNTLLYFHITEHTWLSLAYGLQQFLKTGGLVVDVQKHEDGTSDLNYPL